MCDRRSNLSPMEDVFKRKFKYYKSNKTKPSLSAVISVDDCASKKTYQTPDGFSPTITVKPNCSSSNSITAVTAEKVNEDTRTSLLGLHNTSQWRTYVFAQHPGLFLIRNPFTTLGQRYWIQQCLEVYPRKPNKMNIDIEINLQDWWCECFISGQCNTTLQRKLRWTTLGYHHNWDTKVYTEENKSSFPSDLAELSDIVASYLGYTTFKAEAAIVNYYHMDSTLSAHTDHSEVNLEAPLLSFSFGQSAIFLLGGKDKSIEPSAISLQSGDILVMAKEARLCYHAVPKILPAVDCPWRNLDDKRIENIWDSNKFKYLSDQGEIFDKMNSISNHAVWNKFGYYIEESRINVNVRQVLNDNQIRLTNLQFNER